MGAGSIRSTTIRFPCLGQAKGYQRADFTDAWTRYCPAPHPADVTVDDGKPDRRHVERKTRAEVTRAVRELEKQRDSGRMRKAGRAWTVEQWLTHWLDDIATLSVRYKTLVGYRTDVTRHLVPGLGAHRIDKLEPEHVEKLYGRMIRSGLAAGTVHHAHRTLRAFLSEAASTSL